MDEKKIQAQLPEEELRGVSGGQGAEEQTTLLLFVCDQCGYEAEIPGLSPLKRMAQQGAQAMHDHCKGKTGTCTTGTMVYKSIRTVDG